METIPPTVLEPICRPQKVWRSIVDINNQIQLLNKAKSICFVWEASRKTILTGRIPSLETLMMAEQYTEVMSDTSTNGANKQHYETNL